MLLSGCGNPQPAATATPPASPAARSAYDFTHPLVTYGLPPDLLEISGQT